MVELGKALSQLGDEVHVVTRPLGDMRAREAQWQGMTVYRPRLPRPKPYYSWTLAFWLRRFCASAHPDIIHVHGLRPLEATKNLASPIMFTNHTSGYLKRIQKGERERVRMAKRMAHICHVLAPSQELCDATRAAGYQGPIDFISNGVDTERFSLAQSTLREKLGISNNEIVILLARRLVDKNGVTVFAEAVKALHDLPVRLIFAGDGDKRSHVERILNSNGLFEKSLFLGNVPNTKMPDVYQASDISVLPSFMEATSITGLESMACGLPLVGTRVGGIPTLIEEGGNGIMVSPGDAPALGSALKTLVLNPDLRVRMGKFARKQATARFSWLQIAATTREIYTRHLGAIP